MWKRIVLATLSAVLILAAVRTMAQETITLTAPIVRPSIGNYTPQSLLVRVSPDPHITVTIMDNASGDVQAFEYPCPPPCVFSTTAQVTTLITALNTANLATRSLWRRVFDRLLLDYPTRFPGGATVQ